MERRKAQMCCLALGIACEAMMFRKRIALRRSIAAILGEGTVLPGADGGGTRLLIRTAFAAFIHTASSRERQSHVVGPDGDPSLPDDVCARHARGRRILLRFKAPSRSTPHEQDVLNLSGAESAGMRIPITKCCSPSLRGAKRRSNPVFCGDK